MLIITLLPAVFGVQPMSFRDKLTYISETVDETYRPIADFPTFPTRSGDDTFWTQFGNFFRYVGSIGYWVVDFLAWTFNDVVIALRIVGVALFNYIPGGIA